MTEKYDLVQASRLGHDLLAVRYKKFCMALWGLLLLRDTFEEEK